MIELLARLFARRDTPADRLLHAAIDAVIAGTDSRLHAATDVAKHLREPVRGAIAFVRTITEPLGPAVELTAETYGAEPRVHALFGSVESMRQAIGRDPNFRRFERETAHAAGDNVFALLLADRQLKHVLGMELHGEMVLRDLAKTLLVFANHRLRAVAATEAESVHGMRILAFRQLVAAARDRLAGVKAGQPIEAAEPVTTDDTRVAEIVGRVRQIGAATLTLDDYVALVADVLAHPERHLRAEPFCAMVDRMGALVEDAGAMPSDVERVRLWEFRRAGREAPTIALRVRLRPGDFPPPRLPPELL